MTRRTHWMRQSPKRVGTAIVLTAGFALTSALGVLGSSPAGAAAPPNPLGPTIAQVEAAATVALANVEAVLHGLTAEVVYDLQYASAWVQCTVDAGGASIGDVCGGSPLP